ncbi:MAG: DUF1993 family protein [Hyalangium sp.]|uniref:DUF1993 domain-containing protein n=1 Tax=Hyalangium sp. TaxID=2028555 RepID=UPI00389B2C79
MSLSMYQASIPVFVRMLNNLSAILGKAAAHAEAKKIDPSVFIRDRLAPDMLPLSFQVQTASDMAKGCAARLAGIQPPSFPDTEATFPELKERVAKTLAFLQTVSAAQIDGSEDRNITLRPGGGREYRFVGQSYLLTFVLPNFYFHITTAYNILRHNGVELGKQDFLGDL